MCISVALCLLVCCLILFFLFPRTITILPVSVQSVMVYFPPDTIDMQVTVSSSHSSPYIKLCTIMFSVVLIFMCFLTQNLLNITNENYLDVKILDFSVQVLINQRVMKRIKIKNITVLKQRSEKSVSLIHQKYFFNNKLFCIMQIFV